MVQDARGARFTALCGVFVPLRVFSVDNRLRAPAKDAADSGFPCLLVKMGNRFVYACLCRP